MTKTEAMNILCGVKDRIESHYDKYDKYPEGFDESIAIALDKAMDIFTEFQKYKAIGSVEECFDAVEKQKADKSENYTITNPRKPTYRGNCPTCYNKINLNMDHCQKCGQALDLTFARLNWYNKIEFHYKGHRITQSNFSSQYRIFDIDDHCVLHAQYNKPLTRDKAEELIESYLTMFDKED